MIWINQYFNDLLSKFDISIYYMEDLYNKPFNYALILPELVKLSRDNYIVIQKIIYTDPVREPVSLALCDCYITENCIIQINSNKSTDSELNISHDNWFVSTGQTFTERKYITNDINKPTVVYHMFLSANLRSEITMNSFIDEHKLFYIHGQIHKKYIK